MQYLGSIGLGLVWGWLLSSRSFVNRPVVVISLTLSPALLSVEVFWLAGWRSMWIFLAAVIAAAFVHSQWRRELRQHYETQTQGF
jgi:hypothetical protein